MNSFRFCNLWSQARQLPARPSNFLESDFERFIGRSVVSRASTRRWLVGEDLSQKTAFHAVVLDTIPRGVSLEQLLDAIEPPPSLVEGIAHVLFADQVTVPGACEGEFGLQYIVL